MDKVCDLIRVKKNRMYLYDKSKNEMEDFMEDMNRKNNIITDDEVLKIIENYIEKVI